MDKEKKTEKEMVIPWAAFDDPAHTLIGDLNIVVALARIAAVYAESRIPETPAGEAFNTWAALNTIAEKADQLSDRVDRWETELLKLRREVEK